LNVEVRIGAGAGPEPGLVSGEPDQVVERLLGFRERGFTTFNLKPVGPARRGQVERLAVDVLPRLRKA
ncbi:MAG TPA: hypothetical protein VMW49_01280, partial [Candidatus Dormibacteraeota bacterium]|nr:hypothetical protein [Candidatus Dormibacteraeota bacterium]